MATTKELYRVRKSWADSKSQLGAYSILDNAKKTCDKAGAGYYVFNSKGEVVYPVSQSQKPDTASVDTSAADPKVIWNYLKAAGLNDYAIAGVMGNLQAESALRPTNLQQTYEKSLGMTDAEYTAAVDDGSYTNFVNDKAGYGLAQWTYYTRKQNLLNYCKKLNKSIGNLDAQLGFLVQELSTNFKSSVWNVLLNATSVREASNVVLFKFEAPANQSESVQDTRASYSQSYYDKFATPASTTAQTGFTPRTTAPSESDRYWIHTDNDGLNTCLKISTTTGSCLPNCVGYAWGRFYEITGKKPSLSRSNAENWYGYTQDGYTRSQTPVEGAVICWRKGEAGNGSDGAGHVAIVEEVKSNGDVITSNSGYNSTRFYMQTITKASGYSCGSAYTFQGFILPPGKTPTTTTSSTPTTTTTSGGSKMKYNSNNKPLVCMMTQSTCYKGTSKMTPKGVLWHSTGANNPTLKRYVQPDDNAANRDELIKLLGKNQYNNDWNHIERQAGLNCWIGKLADGTVTTVQTMPWDYKPWGCGSGPKGSCNNGWIQFEICEDGLTDKTYFNKVYQEACEITAYLCDMYNIDPLGTITVNGVAIPTILDHAASHDLGFGSNHGDIMHWFGKYNKSLDDIRADVAKLMGKSKIETTTPTTSTLYRVRKSWTDSKSQIGAYTVLANAKTARDKAGSQYYVFDGSGNIVYPEIKEENVAAASKFTKGDKVKLVTGSTYYNGTAIKPWVFNRILYVRDIRDTGDIVISTVPTGAITGVVKSTSLIPYDEAQPDFQTYIVKITADVLNVRAGAGTKYKINTQVSKNQLYTIVDEDNGWGKLKSGAGWISLAYTAKV